MNEEINVKKRRKKNIQDKQLENRVISIYQIIDNFQNNSEARLILAECGYSDLTEGSSLQKVALQAVVDRTEAIANQYRATRVVQDANRVARTAYGNFRMLAQIVLKTDADRTALSLNVRIPADRARFIRQARASFEAALTPDYAPALARRGYPESVIRDGLARLDALVAADAAQLAAKAAAQQATADRRAAMRRLDDWFIEFRDIAKIALRHRSDWVALLKIR